MGLTLELYGDTFPAKYEICPRCDGTGSHVNPAVDGNGLSSEDIDELGGQDFMDDYLEGVYDVPCEECHGSSVVLILDPKRASQGQIEAYNEHLQARWELEAEYAAERRMGA